MGFDKQGYEDLRALIVWLGLTELAWIAFFIRTYALREVRLCPDCARSVARSRRASGHVDRDTTLSKLRIGRGLVASISTRALPVGRQVCGHHPRPDWSVLRHLRLIMTGAGD